MDSYTIFSEVYDTLMSDIPYEKWVNNLEKIWDKYGLTPEFVIDLACGSGTITKLLIDKGYETIGIDLSTDMLMKAREKVPDALLLNLDMRDFYSHGLVDCIICLCDSVNYLQKQKDVLKMLTCSRDSLDKNGLLIFDMNTKYKFKELLGENVFADNFDNFSYIWHNYFDEEKMKHEYETTFFMKNEDGNYEKYSEIHYEKCYNIDEIEKLIKESGLEFLGVFDENLFDVPFDKSERVYFVCRKV